jgi:hypothetical protein
VALWAARRRVVAWGSYAPGAWLVILPSMAALAMYAIVLVEFRYVAPFEVMLLLWVLGKIRIVAGAEPRLLKRLHLVFILAPTLAVAWPVTHDLFDIIQNKPYEQWVVAQQLHALGIPAGTDVGFIGAGVEYYWAHLAGVRIIAEIPPKEQPRFIAADAARRQQVLALFSSAGAKAVVTKNADVASLVDGWRKIPGTRYFIWQLPWLIAAPEKK